MKGANGQALVELTLFFSVLGLLFMWGIPELQQRLQERFHGLQILALHLQQQPLREQVGLPSLTLAAYQEHFNLAISADYQLQAKRNAEYPVASVLQPIMGLFDWQEGFSLPLDTLYHGHLALAAEPAPWLGYVRLTDGWAPRSLHDLVGRPQALTTGHYLHQFGFRYVQDVVSILPFAREFSREHLRLGFIQEDVVPTGALCSEQPQAGVPLC